ncbi:MAG: DUF6538 domain-containing protein [Kiloniellales bacterium]
MRVPKDLVPVFGKAEIRKSLKTSGRGSRPVLRGATTSPNAPGPWVGWRARTTGRWILAPTDAPLARR